ncbi:hypothetical protein PAPYR_6763 [Paratrimastix pyriformis]|uniref:Uncharacterized protein n=1 Tax=Paratrimastix pyriformis TaxID=342808 RepID=A0ABQ8UEP7_9EUKA|nr:hypothetical protein PAPYR_6763 [Paratrimastix pyriformis]
MDVDGVRAQIFSPHFGEKDDSASQHFFASVTAATTAEPSPLRYFPFLLYRFFTQSANSPCPGLVAIFQACSQLTSPRSSLGLGPLSVPSFLPPTDIATPFWKASLLQPSTKPPPVQTRNAVQQQEGSPNAPSAIPRFSLETIPEILLRATHVFHCWLTSSNTLPREPLRWYCALWIRLAAETCGYRVSWCPPEAPFSLPFMDLFCQPETPCVVGFLPSALTSSAIRFLSTARQLVRIRPPDAADSQHHHGPTDEQLITAALEGLQARACINFDTAETLSAEAISHSKQSLLL